MATQTGSYDFKAAKAAYDSGSAKATSFIFKYTGKDAWVCDENRGPQMSGANAGEPYGPNSMTPTTGWRIGEVFEMVRIGVSWFRLWVESGVAKLRLGRSDSSHITLDGNGMDVSDGTDSIANFGATGRIGKDGGSRFVIGASKLEAYNSSNGKYFEVSASGMTFGTDTVATTDDIPTKVSELTNDSSFATTSQLPTKTSDLTNDSSFATTTQVGTAKTEAINVAASDATSKANAAQTAAAADATTKANAAAKTATSFITATDANGISIHPSSGGSSPSANYLKLNGNGAYTYKDSTHFTHQASDGFHVYSGDASNDAAVFGTESRIGRSDSLNAYIMRDSFAIRNTNADLVSMNAFGDDGGQILFGNHSNSIYRPLVWGDDWIDNNNVRHASESLSIYGEDGDDLSLYLSVTAGLHFGQLQLTPTSAHLSVPLTLDSALPIASGGTGRTTALAYGSLTSQSSALSLTQSAQKVPLSTFAGSGCSASSNGIKVSQAGVYMVCGSVCLYNGFTAGDLVHVTIRVNSNDKCYARIRPVNGGSYETVQVGPAILELAANDTVYLFARNQDGARGSLAGLAGVGLVIRQIG